MTRIYYVFLIVFLGMLSAFGPFVTDMYLPTLPSMSKIFNTTASMVQLGLAASMIGLAVGQIFFGPLSDKYGRRSVLIWAMVLYCISTIAAIFSPTIEFFNVCRLLQGLGASGGIVLSRSVSTDCYSGRELAKTLAIIGAINGIAPVTAPVIGGLVAEAVGWRGIFWILFAIGAVLLLMCFVFRESLPAEKRYGGNFSGLLKSFPGLLKQRGFMVCVLMFAFSQGVLFSYIASASFIIQNHFGFSELMFAVIFGVNAIGIGIGSGLSLKFRRLTTAAMVGAGLAAGCAVLQIAGYVVADSFVIYEILTFIMLLGLGSIFTAGTTMAMDEGRHAVGAASAIFGASGFLFGGIVSPLVGLGDILVPTLVTVLICAVGTMCFSIVVARRGNVARGKVTSRRPQSL